jgi:hypothetical protein
MNTTISTIKPYDYVYVSDFDENIWLSIQLQNGGANVILTKEQAQLLIDQLTKLVETSDV